MELPEEFECFAYTADQSGERLDAYAARVSGESRSRIQQLISEQAVFVNGEHKKANHRVREGDDILLKIEPPRALLVQAEDIPLHILYEDSDICVINKAQGMVVHPAPGNESDTLVNALLFALKDLSGIGGVARPGIVHRLDKNTSGLLVVAKNNLAHASLAAQIKAHTARRAYLAIVIGNIREDSGRMAERIGRHPTDRKRMAVTENGREAATNWRVLARMGDYTLVEAELETGRTHQIRVHMAYGKHPVAGDDVYGPAKNALGLNGQALHAYRLCLCHPLSGEQMRFYAPPPEWFLQALRRAGWDGIAVWEEKE